jgi:site-specific DNA-cytosine methylase
MTASQRTTPPKETPRDQDGQDLIDIELFAGAGGLAVGLKIAGFYPARLYELDPISCQTLNHNHPLNRTHDREW